jgi:membrane protease YdiL (CAAX protease family)
MEDLNQPLDAGLSAESSEHGLKITNEIRAYWRETANWALFLSVLMFIGIGIVLIGMLFGGLAGASGEGGAIVLVISLFLYALVLFFPAWYYYKFSSLTKQALLQGDNNDLEDGFDYLKRFYRFTGILIIAGIALYILMLIFGLSMLSNMGRYN